MAVKPACTGVPVRSFGTITRDLHELADWFKMCDATSVAMESTVVYRIPVHEVLEQRGLEVILVNARRTKNVPDARPMSVMPRGLRQHGSGAPSKRNPYLLATYGDVRCHSSIATIHTALVGNDRHEHPFALPQSL
ncbi:hypothetical protein MTX26_26870 [Bradyrhizobium sp. ISRA443]|uniref:hypothetical protein n=2 Tax=Bradyrhizobium TaxID=374 RepID=UPI00247940CC|nr:hypothetical protein [Bradyrhizobium sp. ISRA443]WGR93397.1 hypothetical protein MTX20_01665 [Bradyrhizobium sp. ISRA435]WGS11708.1 hypothetical protein MTX26_26870 [Bradyrhizobium sp. ISRA443]